MTRLSDGLYAIEAGAARWADRQLDRYLDEHTDPPEPSAAYLSYMEAWGKWADDIDREREANGCYDAPVDAGAEWSVAA